MNPFQHPIAEDALAFALEAPPFGNCSAGTGRSVDNRPACDDLPLGNVDNPSFAKYPAA